MIKEPVSAGDELTIKEIIFFMRQLRCFSRYIGGQYIKGMRRYRVLMSILAILGVVVAIYLIGYKPVVFEAKASFIYNSLQKKVYGEMADKLSNLVQTRAFERLADVLNITHSEAQSIQKLRAVNIFNSLLSEDMAENSNQKVFYIEIQSVDYKAFLNLGKAIENYFNSNIAVKETSGRQIEEMKAGIAYRQIEKVLLDSLVRSYSNGLNRAAISTFPTAVPPIDPVKLFEKGERIAAEMADMRLFLEDHRTVKIQEGFLVSPNALRPSLPKISLAVVGGYLLVSGFILLVFSIAKKEKDAS